MIDEPRDDIDEPPVDEEEAQTKLLERALADFKLCEDRERDNRDDYRADIRFARLGEQWDPDLRKKRLEEGRPCLTVNKLPPIIRGVVNDARQNKPQIKVLPQDSKADPKTAEVQTGLIRNIESSSSADVAYDTSVDCAASGGFGYFRINLAYANDDTWDQDIVFEAVPDPLTIYGDPHSMAADSADWNVAFVTEMVPKAEFKKRWPDADQTAFSAMEYPAGWKEGDEIMVAEYWVREESQRLITLLDNGNVVEVEEYQRDQDYYQQQVPPVFPVGQPRPVPTFKVTQHIMTGTQVLESNPWAGKFIPIVPVYGETVVLEGKRHLRSLIRDAKDPMVMFNAWRTAATELVALAPKAPFIGRKGTFTTDADKWATANTISHAYIEFDGEMPQRQPFAGVPAGALQEAMNAADDIKATTGIYDASLGARSNETSGVAIRERQGQADNSTFHFIDNLSRSIKHAGRILLDLIPKVYGVGRVLRILGEDGTESAIKVGDPNEQPQDPSLEQVGEILPIYDLASGKYDLTVSVGPGFNTRREEAATQMIEAARAFPGLMEVAGDLIAKNLDWPGASEIAERLAMQMQQRQQAQQQPQGQPPQQPDPAAMIKAQTDAMAAQAQVGIDQEKVRIDGFKAETDRIKVMHEIQQPTPLRTVAPGTFAGGLTRGHHD